MTHDDVEAIAALDALGAATAEETRAMSAHIATCNSCRRAREEYAEAATLLVRSLEPVAPPEDVRDRVLEGREVSESRGVIDFETARPRNRATSTWWLATATTLGDVVHEVERDVGVRTEAQFVTAVGIGCHELREHVGGGALQVSRHVRVVEAGVGLLGS